MMTKLYSWIDIVMCAGHFDSGAEIMGGKCSQSECPTVKKGIIGELIC